MMVRQLPTPMAMELMPKSQSAQQNPNDIQKDRAGGHVPEIYFLTKGHENQLRKA